MTLIVLLLVLITERVGLQSTHWQVQTYLNAYLSFALPKYSENKANKVSLLLFIAAPAIVLYLLLYLLDSGFISFIVSLFILAICIGNPQSRALYRQYLNAVGRGDTEAQMVLESKLALKELELEPNEEITEDNNEPKSATEEKPETLGETLIWINFRYYAVPIFYFVILGIESVVLYSTLLYLVESREINQKEQLEQCDGHNNKWLDQWLEWSYWLPSRLVSLGFMVVGNFTNGLETWLRYAVNFKKSSKEMLCQVAIQSEKNTNSTDGSNAEHMVKLTKRNMGLFIVVVALLTLYGQIG